MIKVILLTLTSMMLAACGNKGESCTYDANGGIFGNGVAELVKYNTELKTLEDAEQSDKEKEDYDASTEKLLKRQVLWKKLDELKSALAETLIGFEVLIAVSEATPASILQPFTVKMFAVKKFVLNWLPID